jgi:hypothetical protein
MPPAVLEPAALLFLSAIRRRACHSGGYAGRKDEAQKQFALAAVLYLSSDDKTELAMQPQSKI